MMIFWIKIWEKHNNNTKWASQIISLNYIFENIICVKLCCFMHVMTAYKCCRWSKQLLSSHMYTLHKQTIPVAEYIYNKCVSAWQQLQTYRETYILMLIWTWQLVMCVCVYVHKFKRHAWKKRVQRTLGQRTLDIWQRMFYVVYLHW